MIKNPVLILIVLLGIQSLVLYLNNQPVGKRLFGVLPHIFWIYFLPMLLSTFGIIDPASIVYGHITRWILPTCLVILLMTVDLKSVFRLGPAAIGIFLTGSLGIALGTVTAFSLFHTSTGNHFWSGFGALCGSWTGGSANMIAVKESLSTPDQVFLPFVVVDAVLPYVWMALLMAGSSWQIRFDRWNRVNPAILDHLKQRIKESTPNHKRHFTVTSSLIILLIGLAAAVAARQISTFLPVIKDAISPFTWTIILASAIGLSLSCTPVRQMENRGASPIGYFLLYLVLTAIGAKADLTQLSQSLMLLAAGGVILAVHAVVLLLACRIGRIPVCLAAAASQANIGGVASAPIVAEIYHAGLAPVGLLMAIFGNILGTYIGIAVGHLCRLIGA